MYNQTEAIMSQYELKILQTTKGRGMFIFDTEMGCKSLVPFRGSKEKGEFLKVYLEYLKDAGLEIEQILLNKDREAVTEDEFTGERFLVKDYIKGVEANTGDIRELVLAVETLADYHRVAEQVEMEKTEQLVSELETKEKHYRELVKVKNYIRGRKKKNAFDQMYLSSYEEMIDTAEKSLYILKSLDMVEAKLGICHGDLNQHNVLKTDSGWRIVNFENFFYGWTILDLANFLRKMLEKNNWSEEVGKLLLEAYNRKCALNEVEYRQLYGLLLFPEKFWKISNHYMSSRKSWISERDIEKLKKVIEQEELRKNFVRKIFPFSEE